MNYRITGPQSIERLEPLLCGICNEVGKEPKSLCGILEPPKDAARLDLVWETACEQAWREQHGEARVLNRLHNTHILEDKGNLAFLQLRMGCPVLETFIATGSGQVHAWASARWAALLPQQDASSKDWWVVKVSRGNGGRDVWIMNALNYHKVLEEFGAKEDLVIQKYVHSPLLWRGKKFHFRAYSVLRADLSAFVYEKAFILTAGSPYDVHASVDTTKHITNLSINKRFAGHPGQVVCHVPSEYPQQFEQISEMWRQVAKACEPFMREQASASHFEFYGIDVVADTDGTSWLVEVNRLPGLESSKNNKQAEDGMYDEMMDSLLRLVLAPLPEMAGLAPGKGWVQVAAAAEVAEAEAVPVPAPTTAPATWKNTFSWRAFTRKADNRGRIVLGSASEAAKVFTAATVTTAVEATCGVEGCTAIQGGRPALRCGRCKMQLYCGQEHQKLHFAQHKLVCRPPASASASASASTSASAPPPAAPAAATAGEVRISRCMFCGEEIQLRSEEEAVEHMRQCPALQEQLQGKEQFTIPKVLRDKGVGLSDVKNAKQI